MLQLLFLFYLALVSTSEHKMKFDGLIHATSSTSSSKLQIREFKDLYVAVLEKFILKVLVEIVAAYDRSAFEQTFSDEGVEVSFKDIFLDTDSNLLVALTADLNRVLIYGIFDVTHPIKSLDSSIVSEYVQEYEGLAFHKGRIIIILKEFLLIFSTNALDTAIASSETTSQLMVFHGGNFETSGMTELYFSKTTYAHYFSFINSYGRKVMNLEDYSKDYMSLADDAHKNNGDNLLVKRSTLDDMFHQKNPPRLTDDDLIFEKFENYIHPKSADLSKDISLAFNLNGIYVANNNLCDHSASEKLLLSYESSEVQLIFKKYEDGFVLIIVKDVKETRIFRLYIESQDDFALM